ncbi:hypothetical protein [Fusobacterium sp. HMSC073F01]|uniref:hypothetical protein n=1 Tax=Fusobacterium sp. HMSC073F01 TaxID=1739251 RepID=UPI0008A3496C|nr:hypothetical protein [Fusobacterium sp. HMSC073F01]OFL92941.1 hypothetical protein HMPREF2747_06600 [Fusobacterium sp. HMSC073F01]
MWICKKCGSKITGDVSGTIDNGWGYPDEDGSISMLDDYSLDYAVDHFVCSECGELSKNLEEIAVWED